MLNVTKIKKLITKNVKINGASFPPTDDKPATDILFTIEGYVAFKISSYDTEIVAKLIEVGAMELDYSFKNKSDLTKLFDVSTYDLEPYKLTPVTLTEGKTQIAVLHGTDNATFVNKAYTDCFKDDHYYGYPKERRPVYYIENGKTTGLIMPFKVDSVGVIQDIASKTTPTVTITERDGDTSFGYCSHCHRAERLRTWDAYKYCPVCGYKVSKGGGTK